MSCRGIDGRRRVSGGRGGRLNGGMGRRGKGEEEWLRRLRFLVGIRAERTSIKLRRAGPEHWRCVFNSGAPCTGQCRNERMGGKTNRKFQRALPIWSTSHHRSII